MRTVLALVMLLALNASVARATGKLQGLQQVTYIASAGEAEAQCGSTKEALVAAVKLPLNAYTKIREAPYEGYVPAGSPLVYVKFVSFWSPSYCTGHLELRVYLNLMLKLPHQSAARAHEVILWSLEATTGAPPDQSGAQISSMVEQLAKRLAADWQRDNPQ